MTTQPSDEDGLIQAARAERGEQRSGRSMGASLGVAIAFAAVGGVLVFVPRVISMLYACRRPSTVEVSIL